MALNRDALKLYLVTDPGLCPGSVLIDTVRAAVRGGVSFVQLRDKHATTAARVEAARALMQVLSGTGVPLVINDDLEAALAAEVDGVHIGQGDVSADVARARLGPEKIVGLSCETPAHVCAADAKHVDYLGLGTVFPTASKADHKPTIGLHGLTNMAGLTQLPCVAIGGLKKTHAAGVLAAGCDGMAVVSAICGQPDPERAAWDLCHELDQSSEAT